MTGGYYGSGSALDGLREVRSAEALERCVLEIGFLPLFAGGIEGFSVEERVPRGLWWTGDAASDPWVWRETIAAGHRVAYGKFFGGRAGFISPEWLPAFANCRRDGYDFDSLWQSGLADRRARSIMACFMDVEADEGPVFTSGACLSTELKIRAGFGKGGEKNYPGILTGLQMQLYLVISGFRRRVNRRGEAYGMPVSLLEPPEAIWGRELISSASARAPAASRAHIAAHLRALCPGAADADIARLVG